ncbi:GNAT family N-acetyltransferase [Paenibacillus albidus]|uniref:GNAT family N-acetyltransferase n=1 Tax=Paenibacillus albidus TaxID=2041023 RepID=UPI001BE4FCDC|nr:GNAT family N-acetyltransferase [Paenibacillus albidus]MBT2287816.1 GNAT family N-acetyltransferase [Paenibacillus albidus]
MVKLRKLVPEDAAKLLELQHRLDRESKFMLLEPDERHTQVRQAEEMIRSFAHADTSLLICAEAEGQLVGYLSVCGKDTRRNRHSAYIVIGILFDYQGMGIGATLFREMEIWAAQSGIVRLELTVMTHNEQAIGLYTKSGFEIEGTKRRSLLIDGQWVDEYYMSKIIPDPLAAP